jgi:hypothetical protein
MDPPVSVWAYTRCRLPTTNEPMRDHGTYREPSSARTRTPEASASVPARQAHMPSVSGISRIGARYHRLAASGTAPTNATNAAIAPAALYRNFTTRTCCHRVLPTTLLRVVDCSIVANRSAAGTRATAHGYDTGAWAVPVSALSWTGAVRSDRITVRPGVVAPLVAYGAAVGWCVLLAVISAVRHEWLWATPAGIAAVGGLVLAYRGFPLFGSAAVLMAMACWAFVTRSFVPGSPRDLAGLVNLAAGNLALAGPLVYGFAAAICVDGRRAGRVAVTEALADRRWFGVNRGEPEPQLPALEQLPAARFFALAQGRCAHLVVAGRRVALVASTVWPRGEYAVEESTITRNGHAYGPGTDDVDRIVDDLRYWRRRLRPTGATCAAFLVVHPANGRINERVRIWTRPVGGVHVLTAPDFAETAGGFLVPEANRLNVVVLDELADLYTPSGQSGRSGG